MTDEQKRLVETLLTRYGSPSNEGGISIHEYCVRPSTLDSTRSIQLYDRSAADAISRLETAIQQLAAYRVALAERYAELETAPKIPVVKLTRERDKYGDDRIYYRLTTCRRNLIDGHDLETETTTYPGKERRKAIAAFNDYVKAHPGITAEMDIEKKPWER